MDQRKRKLDLCASPSTQMESDTPKDECSIEYQRKSWVRLIRKIRGCINKVNATNIRLIAFDLMRLDLTRGQGIFCKEVLHAVQNAPESCRTLASLISVVNAYYPFVGKLLLSRIVHRFQRALRGGDPKFLQSLCALSAELTIFRVVDQILLLQIFMSLIHQRSEHSIDVLSSLFLRTFRFLMHHSPKAFQAVTERCRILLNEEAEQLSFRSTTQLNEMFREMQRNVSAMVPYIPDELDLVEESQQTTHDVALDESLPLYEDLDRFRFDDNYAQHEKEYHDTLVALFGNEDVQSEHSENDAPPVDDGPTETEADSYVPTENVREKETVQIAQSFSLVAESHSDTARPNASGSLGEDDTTFQKSIIMILKGSMNPSECAHKILKMNHSGNEERIISAILKTCTEQKVYSRFYGTLCSKLASTHTRFARSLENAMKDCYMNADDLTQKLLRQFTQLLAHLLYNDSVRWNVLEVVSLTDEDTTSARRVFVRYLFEELATLYSIPELKATLSEPSIRTSVRGLFPSENIEQAHYALQFFAVIGLSSLTSDLQTRYRALQQRQGS